MSDIKISVIIPIYNVGGHLKETLDSITSQSFDRFEAILIDDGSSDDSAKMCDSYASKYDFIRVHHQANSGVSVARNAGIELAQGEWICFLDGDDLLCEGALRKCYEAGLDSSIEYYLYNAKRESVSGEWRYTFPIPDRLKEKIIKPRYSRSVVWGALYNREFIMRHNLRFLPGVVNSQDTIFAYFAQHYAEQIHTRDIDLCLIKYRKSSASRSWSEERFDSYIRNFERIGAEILSRGIDYKNSPILNKLVYLKSRYIIRASIAQGHEDTSPPFSERLIKALKENKMHPIKGGSMDKPGRVLLFNHSIRLYKSLLTWRDRRARIKKIHKH